MSIFPIDHHMPEFSSSSLVVNDCIVVWFKLLQPIKHTRDLSSARIELISQLNALYSFVHPTSVVK